MSKVVWIINHYATDTYFEKAGRHYYMAKYLKQKGYEPIVICANIRHNSQSLIPTEGACAKRELDGIEYVFVKIMEYGESRVKRVLTMFQFYRGVVKISKNLPTPYAIIGSSVHPLACIASNKLGKRYGVRSICEIRDLWPESIVAYGIIKRSSLIAKILYAGEKWIYKRADKIVMTWAGGYDYIVDRGWEKDIKREKVCHISNGVDLNDYNYNLTNNVYEDEDLKQADVFKFIYTGSVRPVNNLNILVDAAAVLRDRGYSKAKILVWGDGDQREELEEKAREKGLGNIAFKGRVEKKYIPSILSQGDVSVLHNTSTALNIYGQSQNKFFEYLAAGKPILMTYSVGHSICREQKCGVELQEQTPEAIADAIIYFSELNRDDYSEYCRNALTAAQQFDFPNLADKLIGVIED